MPIRPIEVSTFSKIPSFVPFGVEYFTQDTADLYVGTGASSGPAVTAVNGGGGGAGTVTSVSFTGDGTVLSATPSAVVTTAGSLQAALANASANTILGNATGGAAAPTYGQLVNGQITNSTIDLTAKVTGVLPAANGGIGSVVTADQGFFMPHLLLMATGTGAVSIIVGAANQVRAIQFVLPYRVTVRRITWAVQGSAGDTVSFGIYSADGATKLVDSGATVSAGASAAQQVTISAATLPAGAYIFAYTQTGTPSTTFTTVALDNLGGPSFGALLNVNSVKKMGTAANSATLGALPPSLGAITSVTTFSIPVVVFEP